MNFPGVKRHEENLHYVLVYQVSEYRNYTSKNLIELYRSWIIDKYTQAISYYNHNEFDKAIQTAEALLQSCSYPFDYTEYYVGYIHYESDDFYKYRYSIQRLEPIRFDNYIITREKVEELIKSIPKRKQDIQLKQRTIETERLRAEKIRSQISLQEKNLEFQRQEEKIANLVLDKMKLQKEFENEILSIQKESAKVIEERKLLEMKSSEEKKLLEMRLNKEQG